MDNKAAVKFLQQYAPEGPWVLTSIQLDRKGISTATFHPGSETAIIKWLKEYNSKRNIYFHVNPPIKDLDKKADRSDIRAVTFLHVDVDPRAGEDLQEEQVRALGLFKEKLPEGVPKPTCVIFSGGGYQAFWKLAEEIPVDGDLDLAEDAKRYNQQLEVIFGGDNCHNIDRIMRLPGTMNIPDERKRKKGREEVQAEVIWFDPKAVYELSEFSQAPLVQTPDSGMGSGTVGTDIEVSTNLEFITDLDALNEWDVPDRVKVAIAQGRDPDNPKKGDDSRSAWVFDVCCNLIRCKVPDQVIFTLLMDPGWLISESILEWKGNAEKYAVRQIERAKENAIDPVLAEFNDQFAVISNLGGKVRVVEEITDEVFGRAQLTYQTFSDFTQRFRNRTVEVGKDANGNPKFKKAGTWWLDHVSRRTYHTLTFAPGREIKGSYNLWKGFACESKPGDCELFLDHLRDNVCRNDETLITYLMCWLARMFQHPNRVGETAIVLRGGRGTGKSFFANEIGKLFGRHFLQVSNSSHLVGNFNTHLRDLVMLFADEAFYAGDKRHESILKTLVTEPNLTIEAKGVDIESAPNYIHLIMASNDIHVIPAGRDERRYFVLDVGEGHKQDSVYFGAIAEQLNNGGREALLHYFRTYDLEGFQVRDIPETEALREQKLYSLSPDEEWWYHKLYYGQLLDTGEGWPREVQKDDLHADYREEMDRNKVISGRRGTQTALGRFLKRVVPKLTIVQRRAEIEVPAGDGWTRKIEKRPYFYQLATLTECREEWERSHGRQDWLVVVRDENPPLKRKPEDTPF